MWGLFCTLDCAQWHLSYPPDDITSSVSPDIVEHLLEAPLAEPLLLRQQMGPCAPLCLWVATMSIFNTRCCDIILHTETHMTLACWQTNIFS